MQGRNNDKLKAISLDTYSEKSLKRAETEEDDLFKDGKVRKHEREQASKRAVHKVLLWNIYIGGIIVACAMVIRAYHFLMPIGWQWLDENGMKNIDGLVKYLFAGGLGSLLTKYLTRNVEDNTTS
jgi:hypothetical protein